MKTIDLNADLGERPEALADGSDERLMRSITSASIACGGHAGDARTMRLTLQAAKRCGVSVGAHPSYPDRENFGRLPMSIALPELESSIIEQINALQTIACELGIRVAHVKAHGALYHATNTDLEVARMLARAVLQLDPTMLVVAQSASASLRVFREMGLVVAEEAFCDRTYEADGTLRNRKLPGALLATPEEAAAQAASIVLNGAVTAIGGTKIPVRAQTLCVHSDTPQAESIVAEVRRVLEMRGVVLRNLS